MRTHIGPYRVLGWLGGGGDGEVFAAEEPLTGAAVAIKLTRAEPSSGRAGRFIREYQFLRALGVPGVPRARRLGVDDAGRLYLAMDRVEGTAAGAWVDRLVASRGRTDDALARVLAVLARAASRLGAIHDAGLVHGDVKPGCFLVDDADEVAVVDFGGAVPVDPSVLTRPLDATFNTPCYAALELLAQRQPTTASDVWGLSATAYRLLTGAPPAGRGDRHALAAAWERVSRDMLDANLRAAWPGLGRGPIEVILAGFERDVASRPSAWGWAEGLEVLRPEPAGAAVVAPDGGQASEELVALLVIAGEPVPLRALCEVTGRSPRRVRATLSSAQGTRLDGDRACLVEARPPGDVDPRLAGALADALAEEPVGAARIRALAHAGRHAEAADLLEGWLDVLGARGALATAAPHLSALPSFGAALSGRRALAEARVALAGRAPPSPALWATLDTLSHDRLLGARAAQARWNLARHFETFDAPAAPAALGLAWHALERGDPTTASSCAESALAEARMVRARHVEADALLVLAHLRACSAEQVEARRLAAQAIDRWPPYGPGGAEAVALLATSRVWAGEHTAARRLLIDHVPATPVDHARLLVAMAGLERTLGHYAVAEDALRKASEVVALDALAPTGSLAIAHLVERLSLALETTLDTALVGEASERLGRLVAGQLPWRVPALASALARARVRLGERAGASAAAEVALEAACVMRDPVGEMAALAARAVLTRARGGVFEPPTAVLERAHAVGLVVPLVELLRACGQDRLAWRVLEPALSRLDPGDANALYLEPWAAAVHQRARPKRRRPTA